MRKGTASALTALILCGLFIPQTALASRQAEILVPDKLCLAGEEVYVGAYLYRTGLMGMVRPGVQGELLEFFDANGTLLQSLLTDPSGFARIRRPAVRAGRFPVEVRLGNTPRFRAEPGTGNVFVRNGKHPFFFVTLEGGLFRKGPSGPFTMPLNKEAPLPGSAETVTRIVPCSTLVYLTARPMARLNRIRAWLARNDFPVAPILFLESTSAPEDPAGPFLSTDLFTAPGNGPSNPARLVTDDPRLASHAAENNIEVFLLEEREENGPLNEQEEAADEEKNPLIKRGKDWKEVTAACSEP